MKRKWWVAAFALTVVLVGGWLWLGLPQEQSKKTAAKSLAELLREGRSPRQTDSIGPDRSSPAEPVAEVDPQIDDNGDTTGMLELRFLMGKYDVQDQPEMVAVPRHLTDGDGTYHLHRAALTAFQAMHAAARKDSVDLVIVSAFRNFARQKTIWEAKWDGRRRIESGKDASQAYPDPADRARAILRYSSMPGTSRHHWGTDLDLNRLNNQYFASGEGAKIYAWLQRHAKTFGFCQPYTAKGDLRPDGYEEEKWHWSYQPLAERLTALAQDSLRPELITGFAGSESADSIDVVNKYVLGINPACRE